MPDTTIEEALRSAFRAESDHLGVTITAAELERRLVVRRRSRTGRNVQLLAAAIAIVAFAGIAAVSNGWLALPKTGAAASPTLAPSPSPSAAGLGLGRITPSTSGQVLFEVMPQSAGVGRDEPFAEPVLPTEYVVSVRIACVGDGEVTLLVDGHTRSTNCAMPVEGYDPDAFATDFASEFRYTLSNARFEGSYTISPGLAYTILAETLLLPDRLPELSEPDDGTVVIDAQTATSQPDPGKGRGTTTEVVGTAPESLTQTIRFVCLGPGPATIGMTPVGDSQTVAEVVAECDGEPTTHSLSIGIESAQDIAITIDRRVAWHIIVGVSQ